MKRQPRLTKRERKAQGPAAPTPPAHTHEHEHIHCIACGRHLDEHEFEDPASATVLTCRHGSHFPSCVACAAKSQVLLDEHDRSGQPVKAMGAWH